MSRLDRAAAGGTTTSVDPIDVVIVVAVADNGVIGSANGLPWRLKSELRHFRALTLGKTGVMGRLTFLSIGRPLDRRTNIVVSRDPAFAAPGVVVAPTLEIALTTARADATRRGADAVMVVGGADIYAQALSVATRIEKTIVHLSPEGDAHFPPIDPTMWVEDERAEQVPGPGDDSAFTYVRLRRRPARAAAESHASTAKRAVA